MSAGEKLALIPWFSWLLEGGSLAVACKLYAILPVGAFIASILPLGCKRSWVNRLSWLVLNMAVCTIAFHLWSQLREAMVIYPLPADAHWTLLGLSVTIGIIAWLVDLLARENPLPRDALDPATAYQAIALTIVTYPLLVMALTSFTSAL